MWPRLGNRGESMGTRGAARFRCCRDVLPEVGDQVLKRVIARVCGPDQVALARGGFARRFRDTFESGAGLGLIAELTLADLSKNGDLGQGSAQLIMHISGNAGLLCREGLLMA